MKKMKHDVCLNELSDAALLEEYVQTRDTVFFESLIHKYQGFIAGICETQLYAKEHLIDDAVQTVFLILWRKADTLLKYDSLSGWLYRTGYNVCRTLVRNETRRKLREQHVFNEQEFQTDAMDEDSRTRLYEALNALQARDRDVLTDHYLRQLSCREMARNMNCSEEATKKRLARARIKLRQVLERRGAVVSMALLMARLQAEGAMPPASGEYQPITPWRVDPRVQAIAQAVLKPKLPLTRLAWAVALALMALGLLVVAGPFRKTSQLIVAAHAGNVTVYRLHAGEERPVKRGQTIAPDEEVRVGKDAQVLLRGDTACTLLLREQSAWLRTGAHSGFAGRLQRGACVVKTDRPMRLATAHAVIDAADADFFLMIAESSNAFTRVDVCRGAVEVHSVLSRADTLHVTQGQGLCLGTAYPGRPMPSHGRELSPKFGGVFYKDYADHYATHGFWLTSQPFKPGDTLVQLTPVQLRERIVTDATCRLANQPDDPALIVLPGDKQTSLELALNLPYDRAVRMDIDLERTHHTSFYCGLRPDTIYTPHPYPKACRQPYNRKIKGQDLQVRLSYTSLQTGCTPDGKPVFEKRLSCEGRSRVHWYQGEHWQQCEQQRFYLVNRIDREQKGPIWIKHLRVEELTRTLH